MGKKSRLKRERQQTKAASKPPAMDPVLIEAYTKGRSAGLREGKVDGMADTFVLFNQWIEDIDQHVKGIGPKTKREIETYLGSCIEKAVRNNRIQAVEITKELPAASNE